MLWPRASLAVLSTHQTPRSGTFRSLAGLVAAPNCSRPPPGMPRSRSNKGSECIQRPKPGQRGERFSPIRFSLTGRPPSFDASRRRSCAAPPSEKRSLLSRGEEGEPDRAPGRRLPRPRFACRKCAGRGIGPRGRWVPTLHEAVSNLGVRRPLVLAAGRVKCRESGMIKVAIAYRRCFLPRFETVPFLLCDPAQVAAKMRAASVRPMRDGCALEGRLVISTHLIN
jgi:hypothetical protein